MAFTEEDINNIEAGLSRIHARSRPAKNFRNYRDGRHSLRFATGKFRNAFGEALKELSINFCEAVITSRQDRLNIASFDIQKATNPAAVATALEEILDYNEHEILFDEYSSEGLTTGNVYLQVWRHPDNGMPILTFHGGDECAVGYDQERGREVVWAVRAWKIGKVAYVNYWKKGEGEYGEFYKYRSTNSVEGRSALKFGHLSARRDEGDMAWPIAVPGNKIPIFPAEDRSEIFNVIDPQDALNKAACDELVGQEHFALPSRWVVGPTSTSTSPQGVRTPAGQGVESVKNASTPGALLKGGIGTTFGQFQPADLDKLINVIDAYAKKIGQVSTTPGYILGTEELPGGSTGAYIRMRERPLTARIKRIQRRFGNAWQQGLEYALELQGHTDVVLRPVWEDPSPLTETEKAELALIKQNLKGYSARQNLIDLGITAEEVDRIMEEAAAEGESATAQAMALFNRGQDPAATIGV